MQPTPQPLWKDAAPGALGTEPVDIPTLTTYLPEKPNGSAVVVCPGGGYRMLAAHEGEPFALWLNTLGITAYVLHYRLGPKYYHPVMLQDVSRAIRTVRAGAAESKIDPKRIGVMGFSAGGHLSSSISVHHDGGNESSPDPIERVSSRPDLAVLVYPWITLLGEFAHEGSIKNLLGENDSPALRDKLSSEQHVTKDTPPAFIYHRYGDKTVPLENPFAYAAALRKAGVRFELHLYDEDGHGQGFALQSIDKDWTERLANWLKKQGF